MTEEQNSAEAVSLLQDLGLKEYEARCFLALTGLSTATAKEISEQSQVPRTRVYDAIRVLEAEGLVQIQHTSPQQFRAVGIDEATATLRRKYDDRLDTLESHLEQVDVDDHSEASDQLQEVWSLRSHDAIESRMFDLVEDAQSEIMLLVVQEAILTPELYDALQAATDRGLSVIVGAHDPAILETIQGNLSAVRTFETELDWLVGPVTNGEEVAISRLLFTDRQSLLVSSYYPGDDDDTDERAIFAQGLDNGIVVLLRRILSSGMLSLEEPAD